MNINVLGTEYIVTYLDEKDKQMLENNADGYCDFSNKAIAVLKGATEKEILRHELVHAYLYECGIEVGYGFHNEDVVNYIAMIFPKLNKIFKNAKCED